MKSSKIVVLAADENFFYLLVDAIKSLETSLKKHNCDIGIIDQGLSLTQIKILQGMGATVIHPDWPEFVPECCKIDRNLGLVIRPFLRDIFFGYEYYLWFDADAWAVNSDCLDAYFSGAENFGAAVTLENGKGYTRTFAENKWWYGNLFSAFGFRTATRIANRTSVNIGVLCLKNNAKHWTEWASTYSIALQKTMKTNLDQHCFFAAIHSGGIETKFLDAEYNWLPTLKVPVWDQDKKTFVTPGKLSKPIQIMHLAGPNKKRLYTIRRSDSTFVDSSLIYSMLSLDIERSNL